MATFYVEAVRLPFGGPKACVKVGYTVKRAADWGVDVVSPDMTAVFRVEHVRTATEAVACVLEYAAGLGPCVQLVMGGRKAEPAVV